MALVHAGRRQDLNILDVDVEPHDQAAALRTDTSFAVRRKTQSYGSDVRKTIANWSPHLAWLAPAAAPAGTSAERLKATSLALAAARQSFDKLTTEISKLQAQDIPDARPGSRRASQR